MAEGKKELTIKDLHVENPRWCVGCGDFGILMGLKKFLVGAQIDPINTVNISGIGCSGRIPNYINTYGIHGIHGRPITIATGLALTRPDLNLFVSSGDGDALSIGGNHLLHGINKNINCVFMLFDNELYALTKSQTSPTTRKGHKTNTQPRGTYLAPLNSVRLALGIGSSFVASTADWMPDHLGKTLEAAFKHKGFSFIHISQRCPHFDPKAFNYKSSDWFSFIKDKEGLIPPDKRLADKTETVDHDPRDIMQAFQYAHSDRRYFGLFYFDPEKPCYDEILRKEMEEAEKKPLDKLFDQYLI